MNRVDRLFGILLRLQRHRRVRAQDLARHFEVSERTIYRDIAALNELGVPIISLPNVTRGSTAEDDVLTRKPVSTHVVYTTDQQHSLEELAAGRIDAYATGDAGAQYLAVRSAGQFVVADVHPYRLPEQFAFPLRVASQIEQQINAFIAANAHVY